MILKIISDFSNFTDIMPEIDKYNYTFVDGVLYLSNVKCKNEKSFQNKISKLFNKNQYIVKIDDDNYKLEPMKVQDWCLKQLAWSKIIKFESEQQDQLHNIMNYLDKIEAQIVQERGDHDGSTEEKTGKTSEKES